VLEVGISISLERPDKAKPKGRTMDPAELRVLKLGARGSKKKNRKCKICHITDGHNASTCLQVDANQVRLANLAGKKRGRPPSSKNRTNLGGVGKEVDIQKRRRMVMLDDEDGNEMVGSAMEDNHQEVGPSPAPRKRGRPPGAKKQVNHLEHAYAKLSVM
jgi:hypothetical protein